MRACRSIESSAVQALFVMLFMTCLGSTAQAQNRYAVVHIENPTTTVNTRYKEGLKSLDEKRYAEAIKAFTEVIAQTREPFDAYLMRAQAYRAAREYTKSIDDVTTAIKLNEKSAFAHNFRGLVYEDMQELDKALENYTKAISVQKDFTVAYSNKASILIRKGLYQEAVADLKQALQQKPNPAVLARIHNYLGLAFMYQGECDAAIAAYGDALAADGKFAMAFSNRAGAQYRNGDYYASIRDANEAEWSGRSGVDVSAPPSRR